MQQAAPDFSWILFAVQQIAVPLLSLVGAGLLGALLADLVPESKWVGEITGAIVYAFPGLFGFCFGALARSRGVAFREAGTWIWVIPMTVFAVAFVGTLISDWHQAVPEFFGVRGGDTEEGIVAMFITLPTVACCLYSIGIRLRKSDLTASD